MATSAIEPATQAADAQAANGSAQPARLPILKLAVVVAVAVLLALGLAAGAGFYLVRSGKLAVHAGTPAAKADPPKPVATHTLNLEPILVNLADPGGAAYLRIGISMLVEDAEVVKGKEASAAKPEKEGKGISAAEAQARDAVLTVLGRQSSTSLLAADGKDRIKHEIVSALAGQTPPIKVKDVFFTEFLVQR